MSNRHLSRSIAMQTLFEWDFHNQAKKSVSEMLAFNLAEFAPDFDDNGFIKSLIDGVLKNAAKIDKMIEKYAPEWPLAQITLVDRNILRLGIFELKFNEEIPSKVAINESIELAKTFGGNSSGKFINGVLGAIYREMVEKNQLKKVDLENKKDTKEEAIELSPSPSPSLSQSAEIKKIKI